MARVLAFILTPSLALASQPAVGADSFSLLQLKARAHEADPPVQTGPPPVFLNGDGAEIFIETGTFANSWVPVSILRTTSSGWYDVRVMAGTKKGQNHTDVHSIKPNYLRQVTPEVYDEHLAAFLAGNDSSALAGMVDREANRRKRASAALKKARDYAKEIMNKGCPGEYIVIEGNIPGNDHFGRGGHNQLSSVELCAEDCDRHPGCKAFEFDPLTTVCNLKKEAEPKKNYFDGRYMLCQHFEFNSSAQAATAPVGQAGPGADSSPQAVSSNVLVEKDSTFQAATVPVGQAGPGTDSSPQAAAVPVGQPGPAADSSPQAVNSAAVDSTSQAATVPVGQAGPSADSSAQP